MSGSSSDIRGWINSALADLDNAIHEAQRWAEESGRKEGMMTVAQLEVARDTLVRARDSVRDNDNRR